MLSADWSDGVRLGPDGVRLGPMGSDWVISHTEKSDLSEMMVRSERQSSFVLQMEN